MGRAPASVSRSSCKPGRHHSQVGRVTERVHRSALHLPLPSGVSLMPRQPLPTSDCARAMTLEMAEVAQVGLNGEPRLMNDIVISAGPST